jgi:hypothetical protein
MQLVHACKQQHSKYKPCHPCLRATSLQPLHPCRQRLRPPSHQTTRAQVTRNILDNPSHQQCESQHQQRESPTVADIRASTACAKERAGSLLIKHGLCAPNPHCVVMARWSGAGRARCLQQQPVEIEAGCQPSGPSSPTARADRYIRWEVPNTLFEYVRPWVATLRHA